DVVALALEALVRRDRDVDVEVAAGGAVLAGVAAAGHAQALAGHDAGRNLHPDRLVRPAAAAAATDRAGRVDLHPTAAARGAGRGLHELTERGVRHVLDVAAAPAGGAGLGHRPRLRPAPLAAVAGRDDVNVDLAGDAERGLNQGQVDGHGRVAAAGRPARPSEEVVAEERPEQIGQVGEVHELLGVELRPRDARVT